MSIEHTVTLSPELAEQVADRVRSGEFPSGAALVAEAVRYYLERHRSEDWEEYARQEVAWSRRHAD